MGVKVTRKGQGLQLALQTKLDAVRQELDAAVSDEIQVMIKRTEGGQTIDGGGMKPYSPEYAMRKAQYGGGGILKALTLTGHMLSSITHKVEATAGKISAKVFFNNTSRVPPRLGKKRSGSKALNPVSAVTKAAANDATRPFFGFSAEQVERIKARLQSVLSRFS